MKIAKITKKIIYVIKWFFGILFLLPFIIDLFDSKPNSYGVMLFFLIIALLLIPPCYRLIDKKIFTKIDKKYKETIKNIFFWIFSILFILISFSFFIGLSGFIGRLLMLVVLSCAIFLIPPLNKKLKRRIKIENLNTYLIIIMFILIVIAVASTSTPSSLKSEGNETKIEQIKRILSIKDIEKNINEQLPEGVKILLADKKQTITLFGNQIKLEPKDAVQFVEFYFKDNWLGDDYHDVQSDCAKVYRTIFGTQNQKNLKEWGGFTLKLVYLKVKGTDKDVYGHTYTKDMAESYMTLETYNKINWEGFNSNNLNKITPFRYKEKSFFKDIEDFQKQLDLIESTNMPSFPMMGMPMESSNVPADVCKEAEEQCSKYPDTCEMLDVLKMTGTC